MLVKPFWWFLLTLIIVAACSPETGPISPTPEPGVPYTHPSEVFSLRLPVGWGAGDLSEDASLLVSFTPPGAEQTHLTVYAVRVDAPLDEAAFGATMDAYLNATHNQTLTVLDRTAMGDGSWRATGVRNAGGTATPVNIFMQRDGAFFSALEIPVFADDPAMLETLTTLVNSYSVQENVDWLVGAVEAVPQLTAGFVLAEGNLSFGGLLSWGDDLGRFHITGWLANRSSYAVDGIEIQATLYDEAGSVVVEQVALPPVPVLLDGETTPFDARFDDGRPPDVTRFELRVAARQADTALATSYGAGFFDWEDRAEYDEQGLLHVRGTVWNIGELTAYHTQAIVTVLNPEDLVVGYIAVTVGPGEIAPGDSQRFDAPLPRLGGEPTRYLVTVQAQTAP